MEKYVVTRQNLMEILDTLFDSGSVVYIPQEAAERTDISNDSKFYFGIVFDECARNITMPYHFRQAAETVRHYI